MRTYINVSGTSDSVQRIYILLTSVPLIRYTAHAAALQVEIAVESVPESEEQMDIFVTDDTGYKLLESAVAFFQTAPAGGHIRACLAAAKVPRGPPRASRHHPRPRVSVSFRSSACGPSVPP